MGSSRVAERAKEQSPETQARSAPSREATDPLLALQRSAGNAATALVVQRVDSDGDGGGVAPDLAGRIRSSLGHGSPLPDGARSRLEGGLGADLSGVRVHTDGEASRLSRALHADAFTTGNDLFFSAGKFAPASTSGFEMLAHEAAHVVQQRSGPVSSTPIGGGLALSHPSDTHERAASAAAHQVTSGGQAHVHAGEAPAATLSRSAAGGPLTIQRHSSWEHMLIGDLKPEELETLGAAYDVDPKNRQQQIKVPGGKQFSADDVAHVIKQEINRLKYFQTSPPKGGVANIMAATADLKERDKKDRARKARDTARWDQSHTAYQTEYAKDWDLKLVAVPAQNQTFLVTYGELNTLADFFGSVTEMSNFDPKFFDRIIRGVRQSAMQKLVGVYGRVTDQNKKAAKKDLGLKSTRFKSGKGKDDAIRMGAEGIVGDVQELNLMGSIPLLSKKKERPLVGGQKASSYSSTLARNACHFAPESWHSWAEHHNKAITLADQAFTAEQAGNQGLADTKANDAMVMNGFGDHYLQDSYASGHLINKTQIMSFYTKWLDKQPFMVDFHQNKNWRKVQDMAYGQKGLSDKNQYDKAGVGGQRTIQGQQVSSARNPQAVANMTALDWKGRAEALGLKVPPSVRPGTTSYQVLVAWQAATLDLSRKHQSMTLKQVAALMPNLTQPQVARALGELIYDNVVRRDSYDVAGRSGGVVDITETLKSGTKLVLREAFIPKNAVRFAGALQNPQQHTDMVMGAVYDEYLEFMNSGFLQKATNGLHNHFCEKGLHVSSANNQGLFKVYGDNNMIQSESSKGLRHSGETAKRSMNAVVLAAQHGAAAVPADHSTAAIVDRLPAYVCDADATGGKKLSLADWHNDGALQTFCETSIFPKMSAQANPKTWTNAVSNKAAPGTVGRNLGKIDDRPDKTELF